LKSGAEGIMLCSKAWQVARQEACFTLARHSRESGNPEEDGLDSG